MRQTRTHDHYESHAYQMPNIAREGTSDTRKRVLNAAPPRSGEQTRTHDHYESTASPLSPCWGSAEAAVAQSCPASLGRAMQTHEHCDSNAHTRTANATTGVTPPSSFLARKTQVVHVTRSKRLDQHLDGGCQVASPLHDCQRKSQVTETNTVSL